jgi:hypothetical protein
MQLLYQRVENVAVYAHSLVGKKGYAKGGVAELRRPRHNAQRQVGEIPWGKTVWLGTRPCVRGLAYDPDSIDACLPKDPGSFLRRLRQHTFGYACIVANGDSYRRRGETARRP